MSPLTGSGLSAVVVIAVVAYCCRRRVAKCCCGKKGGADTGGHDCSGPRACPALSVPLPSHSPCLCTHPPVVGTPVMGGGDLYRSAMGALEPRRAVAEALASALALRMTGQAPLRATHRGGPTSGSQVVLSLCDDPRSTDAPQPPKRRRR